jgi:hypothetical protein
LIDELSVDETTVARAFADRAGRVFAATLFVLAIAMAAPMLARAANPAANIDQCRNGTIDAPVQCINNAWENGNLGETNSHYREGDSVPFRAVMTNLDTSITHTLVIQYDTLQSGKHAYDYLTSYNATETNANPTADISGTTAGNCFPIPVDLTIAFANPGSTQEPGCISIWNGTITNIQYGATDTEGQRSVIVTFTATDPTVVIAWGGHIASQIDWGAGNSASAISGSPYHMRLLTLDDTQLGNQDRSLKASGILPIPAVFTTTASPSSITLGASVTDTATLSGSNGAVTGTVKFFVCGPAASNPDCTFGGTQVGSAVTISAGQAVSAAFTPTAVGHYCFRGEYNPDAFAPYSPSNHTDQTLECFTVNPHSPTIATLLSSSSITVGGTIHDSSTLTGATADAGGTVKYRYYSVLADCQAGTYATPGGTSAGDKTVVNGVVPNSDNATFNTAGTYYWRAFYSGDGNNNAASSTCQDETLVVGKATATIATLLCSCLL